MNDFDARIRNALTSEDEALLEKYAEPSMPQQILDSFRGRHSWLVIGLFIFTFVFLGVAIVSAVQFFQAETLRETVGWAVGFALATMTIGLMKVWYWMELNKNVLTREMKRLELQIARLAPPKDVTKR
jgi:uncharacterized membrane protein YciS (DUF1049 family)